MSSSSGSEDEYVSNETVPRRSLRARHSSLCYGNPVPSMTVVYPYLARMTLHSRGGLTVLVTLWIEYDSAYLT